MTNSPLESWQLSKWFNVRYQVLKQPNVNRGLLIAPLSRVVLDLQIYHLYDQESLIKVPWVFTCLILTCLMSFPAYLPEIAVSWPWTFSWQGRCHSFLQNYHHCKTWVIKSWFFFSTRNKMNLLYSTLKKVPILITDQGHWGEQSRWWRWSTESGTQYPIHGPGPTGKNKGTGNSKLDKWTKIYG